MNQNYLENVPVKKEGLKWEQDEKGLVTLYVHNTGIMNKIAQKLFKKPEYTQVHLDENGSFVWPLIDGESDIIQLGEKVKEHFGEKAEPLYPRLAKFFQVLASYGFVKFLEENRNKNPQKGVDRHKKQ